jgi:hypothetical protein
VAAHGGAPQAPRSGARSEAQPSVVNKTRLKLAHELPIREVKLRFTFPQ